MNKLKTVALSIMTILSVFSCKTTEEPNENNDSNNGEMYLIKSTERIIQWKGKNQFSPSVLHDKESGSCMMWFVDGHKNPDEIHYKKSPDCSFTSNQIETSVFTQKMFSKLTGIPTNDLGHLGGPSVVKFNGKYLMFFTTCLYNECHDTKHKQIWSVMSTDGKNWSNPKGPILDDTYFSQPSVINHTYKDETTEEEKEGLRLYFQNRGKGNHRIWSVDLNDKLKPIKKPVSVFKYTQTGVPILEPDVIKISDRFHLFFSTLSPTTGSIRIHHVSSTDPLNFGIKGFKETALIAPKDGASPCGVDTPGAVPVDDNSFYLFYSQVKEIFIDGSCRRYHKIESAIVRDKFTIETVEDKDKDKDKNEDKANEE